MMRVPPTTEARLYEMKGVTNIAEEHFEGRLYSTGGYADFYLTLLIPVMLYEAFLRTFINN